MYSLATAVLFLIKDTFSAAKLLADLPDGVTDQTAGPYGAVSNMLLCVGYCGYIVLYRDLYTTCPLFYVGGIGMCLGGSTVTDGANVNVVRNPGCLRAPS